MRMTPFLLSLPSQRGKKRSRSTATGPGSKKNSDSTDSSGAICESSKTKKAAELPDATSCTSKEQEKRGKRSKKNSLDDGANDSDYCSESSSSSSPSNSLKSNEKRQIPNTEGEQLNTYGDSAFEEKEGLEKENMDIHSMENEEQNQNEPPSLIPRQQHQQKTSSSSSMDRRDRLTPPVNALPSSIAAPIQQEKEPVIQRTDLCEGGTTTANTAKRSSASEPPSFELTCQHLPPQPTNTSLSSSSSLSNQVTSLIEKHVQTETEMLRLQLHQTQQEVQTLKQLPDTLRLQRELSKAHAELQSIRIELKQTKQELTTYKNKYNLLKQRVIKWSNNVKHWFFQHDHLHSPTTSDGATGGSSSNSSTISDSPSPNKKSVESTSSFMSPPPAFPIPLALDSSPLLSESSASNGEENGPGVQNDDKPAMKTIDHLAPDDDHDDMLNVKKRGEKVWESHATDEQDEFHKTSVVDQQSENDEEEKKKSTKRKRRHENNEDYQHSVAESETTRIKISREPHEPQSYSASAEEEMIMMVEKASHENERKKKKKKKSENDIRSIVATAARAAQQQHRLLSLQHQEECGSTGAHFVNKDDDETRLLKRIEQEVHRDKKSKDPDRNNDAHDGVHQSGMEGETSRKTGLSGMHQLEEDGTSLGQEKEQPQQRRRLDEENNSDCNVSLFSPPNSEPLLTNMSPPLLGNINDSPRSNHLLRWTEVGLGDGGQSNLDKPNTKGSNRSRCDSRETSEVVSDGEDVVRGIIGKSVAESRVQAFKEGEDLAAPGVTGKHHLSSRVTGTNAKFEPRSTSTSQSSSDKPSSLHSSHRKRRNSRDAQNENSTRNAKKDDFTSVANRAVPNETKSTLSITNPKGIKIAHISEGICTEIKVKAEDQSSSQLSGSSSSSLTLSKKSSVISRPTNPYHKQTKPSCSNSRQKTRDNVPYKYKEVVRHKDKRRSMPGHVCDECRAFVDIVCGREGEEHNGVFDREEMLRDCSRHRAQFSPDLTPDGFWELSFADEIAEREKKRRGSGKGLGAESW